MPKQKWRETNRAIPEPVVVTSPPEQRSPGTTSTFSADPWNCISHLQQVTLRLSLHSCYPVSSDLMLFPLSGPLLLVLEIIAEIWILPDS